MRNPTLPAFVLAALVAVGPAVAATGSPAAFRVPAERAESLLRTHALTGADGRTFRLGELDASVTVVNFWASWCAPCRRELPRLATLDRELRATGGRVVAISIDEERSNAERFLRRTAPSLGVAFDGPEALAQQLDLRNVPCTIVLDRAGKVAWVTTRSDDAAIAELSAVARRLAAGGAVAAEGAGR